MANQAAVIGLGRYGISLAQELYQLGFDVLGIDTDEQLVQDLDGQLTYLVRADATSESVLRDLGVASFDLTVVAIGTDIQASIMTTLLLKTLGVKQIGADSQGQQLPTARTDSGTHRSGLCSLP